MEQIWQWGIDVIKTVQQIRSPFFDIFFKTVSGFGSMLFYAVFLPLIYWCFDKKYAVRIFVIFLVSSWSNSILKDFFNHPRPYVLDETVKIGKTAGPGLPSGHAQQSIAVWGALSLWMNKSTFSYAAAAVILLIAFSRVYLGVHFPTDIIGGWLIGGVILLALWRLFDRIENIVSKLNRIVLVTVALFLPALMAMILSSKSSVIPMGALSGICIGVILEKRFVNFEAAGNFKSAAARYIAGGVILMIIYQTNKIFISKGTPYYLVLVFVHSWISGVWVSAGAPWLFKKIRI